MVARGGPIFVGDGAMVEDDVLICNESDDGSSMHIGRGNRFEIGCLLPRPTTVSIVGMMR